MQTTQTTAPATALKVWMDSKGYSNSQLAQELGFSYDFIYKVAQGKSDPRNITLNFQLAFIRRFGWDEAGEVFDTAPLRETLEPAI